MTSRKIPESAVENLVSDLEGKVDKTSAQTISGSKRFTQPSEGMSIELTADTNQQTVPAESTLRQLGLYRNSTYTKGDGFTSWVNGYRGSDGWTGTEIYTRRLLESDSQEILNYVKIEIAPDGTPITYTRTPPVSVTGTEIVTAEWVNAKVGGFANTNASNFTSAGKQTIVGWGMPDYTAGISITLTASGNYKAPSKGLFSFSAITQNDTANIYVNNHLVSKQKSGGSSYLTLNTQVFVDKNDVISWGKVFANEGVIMFFPLKGVN